MSSVLENLNWHRMHTHCKFDWSEWTSLLGEVMPLPVYNMLRIVDGCAAHDIALHARHWPEDRALELGNVNLPVPLQNMLAAVGLTRSHQMQYAARALYRQCAERTVGVPILRNVPVDHMDNVPVVPASVLKSLADAADTEDTKQLLCWLQNVIVYGSSRPTTIHSVFSNERQATFRRRGRTAGYKCQAENIQSCVNTVLNEITDMAPECVPRMWCSTVNNGQSRVSTVLYARQQAPSDE